MALTKVSESEVQSSDGYRVRISRGKLTYSEQEGRYLPLEANYVPTEGVLHVYLLAKQRWSDKGEDAGALDPSESANVKRRIVSCLELLGMRHDLHED